MIISTFSKLGLTGNKRHLPKFFFYSGASNYMTNSSTNLTNIKSNNGNLQIHSANESSLSKIAIGDISPSLKDTFLFPDLSTKLTCVVHDQVSRKGDLEGVLSSAHHTCCSSLFQFVFFI